MSRKVFPAVAAVLALVAGACTSGPTPIALAITAEDFSFDAPVTTEGGRVDLTLTNDGDEVHEVQLVSLGEGMGVDDLLSILQEEEDGGPIPDWLGFRGGVQGIPPDATSRASLNLAAGQYALVCFIDGHFARGMIAPMTVTDGTTGDLPAATGTVSAVDYGFEFDGLAEGTNMVRFQNDGAQPHFGIALAFEEGIGMAEVEEEIQRFIADEETQLPEPEPVGGFTALDPEGALNAELTLSAGRVYVFVCFLSDREGGPPHFVLGMATPFELA